MDCSHVREHLSDYLDESLDAKNKALVEEHLSACKDCRQEVASLRMLIKDLGSMETVTPPKDFLDQLHRRMERRSGFSKILDTLSIPIRAKLPMKLAGAVVMAVLVFTIIYIQEDQYGTKIAPIVQETTQSESSPTRSAKTPLVTDVQEETYNTGVVRKNAEQQPQAMRVAARRDEVKHLPDIDVKKVSSEGIKADYPSQEGAWTELSSTKTAPLMQEAAQSESSKAPLESVIQEEADNTRVVWEKEKQKSQAVQVAAEGPEAERFQEKDVKKIFHVESKASGPSRKGTPIEVSLVIRREQQPDIIGAASDTETPQVRETKIRERLMEREQSIDHLLPRLREVIERAGGEVVSVEYEEATHIPESLRIEIPAEQIGLFQNDLKELGELHGSLSGPTGEVMEILPIRIRLLTP